MQGSSLLLVFSTIIVGLATASPVQTKRDAVSEGNVNVSSDNEGSGTYTSGFAASTGPDGKIYYVKNVNGHIEQGTMEGPMPAIDLSGIFANIFPSFSWAPAGPTRLNTGTSATDLNAAIRQSVSQYLQNWNL